MGVKELRNAIKEREGMIVSIDTLLTYDLLFATYAIVKNYDLNPDFKDSLDYILSKPEEHVNYYNSDHPDLPGTAMWLWVEDIFQYFNDIAPKGYYFGNTEGDGACFGWFREEEEV